MGFFFGRGDSTIIGGAHVKIVAIAHTYGGGWEFKLCDILKNEEVKKNSTMENLDIMLEL